MPFDYEANITAVANALRDYNTTTSNPDLSSGLTKRIQNIYVNDPEVVSHRRDIYPAIFVRLSDKTEEYGSLGNTGPTGNKKFATVTFNIIGFYHRDGAHTTHANMLNEIYRLGENMEGVFQKELTLSATALWCNPVKTEFLGPATVDGVLVKAVVLDLEARYLFR